MSIFEDLGKRMSAAYAAAGARPEEFPAVAADVIAASGIAAAFDIDQVRRWLLASSAFPSQLDFGNFGHPPLTTYFDERLDFVVDVYLWLDGDTSIHDHSFQGAFLVAEGYSVQSTYTYDARESYADTGVAVGALRTQETRFLERGSIMRIDNGSRFIHQVIHLAKPTVTVCVRTTTSPGIQQCSYTRNGLRIPVGFDPYVNKAVRFYRFERTTGGDAAGTLRTLLALKPSFGWAVRVWAELFNRHLQNVHVGDAQLCLEIIRDLHPDRADLLEAAWIRHDSAGAVANIDSSCFPTDTRRAAYGLLRAVGYTEDARTLFEARHAGSSWQETCRELFQSASLRDPLNGATWAEACRRLDAMQRHGATASTATTAAPTGCRLTSLGIAPVPHATSDRDASYA